MPEITFHDDPETRRLELHVDGEFAALITYGLQAGILAICHTESEPGFKGQGYATKLVEHTLDRAEANGEQVLPFCSFAAHHIAQHPERIELVPADQRKAFEVIS